MDTHSSLTNLPFSHTDGVEGTLTHSLTDLPLEGVGGQSGDHTHSNSLSHTDWRTRSLSHSRTLTLTLSQKLSLSQSLSHTYSRWFLLWKLTISRKRQIWKKVWMRQIARFQIRSRVLVHIRRFLIGKSIILYQNMQNITKKWCAYPPALIFFVHIRLLSLRTLTTCLLIKPEFTASEWVPRQRRNHKCYVIALNPD